MGYMSTLDLVELYLFSMVGTPYRWGGKTPISGLDCSGFVSEALKSVGILKYTMDLNSGGLRAFLAKEYPTRITTDQKSVVRGAIAFFGSDAGSVYHTAYCLGLGIMIGAEGGDSSVLTLDDAEKHSAFVKMRPLAYRKNFLCAIRPTYPGEAP